jgi:nicotinamidase-related amidase
MTRPWDGIIPDVDLAAFGIGSATASGMMRVGERPALIVVDMTREFVDSAYPTGWSETGYPAAAAIQLLLAFARDHRMPVFFTKARPASAPAPTLAEKGMWKNRSRRISPTDLPHGDVVIDELTPREGEVIITKGAKPSAFFGTQLSSLLIYHKVDTTIITGMSTSGCVRATAVDAFQHNYSVIIPQQACADRCQLSHAVSLFDMHMKYADVVDIDELLDYLHKAMENKLAP